MSNYLRLADTLNAQEGKAYITIDGVNRELFEISSLTAQIELSVTSKRTMGNSMKQHKVTGAEGTGSMTMYFANSELLKQAIAYIKNGTYTGITLQVYNEDKQSTIGKQEVYLYNVIIATVPVAYLEDDSDDPITFDTDFTFDSISKGSYFDLPDNFQ